MQFQLFLVSKALSPFKLQMQCRQDIVKIARVAHYVNASDASTHRLIQASYEVNFYFEAPVVGAVC